MADTLSEILENVTPASINLDRYGRVVITDLEVARRVAELGKVPFEAAAEDQNLGCCKNGYQCGCTGLMDPNIPRELLDIAARFLGRGR